MPKIQVMVDANVHRVLEQMKDLKVRGSTFSQVAYKILDEWIWENSPKLKDWGIVLGANKTSAGKKRK